MVAHDRVSKTCESAGKELKLIIVDPCCYSRVGLIEALRQNTNSEGGWQVENVNALSSLLSVLSLRGAQDAIRLNVFNCLIIILPSYPVLALSLLLQLRGFDLSLYERVIILSDFNKKTILEIFRRIGGDVGVRIESLRLSVKEICNMMLSLDGINSGGGGLWPRNKWPRLSSKECLALLLMLHGESASLSSFKLGVSKKTIYSQRHSGLMVRKLNRPFLSFLTMNSVKEELHMVRAVAE